MKHLAPTSAQGKAGEEVASVRSLYAQPLSLGSGFLRVRAEDPKRKVCGKQVLSTHPHLPGVLFSHPKPCQKLFITTHPATAPHPCSFPGMGSALLELNSELYLSLA